MNSVPLHKFYGGMNHFQLFNEELIENTMISDLSLCSSFYGSNWMFIALKGTHLDGRDFIEDALSHHCSAVLAEKKGMSEQQLQTISNAQVPVIVLDDAASHVSEIVHNVYPVNAEKIDIIGITGTNGKSSICYLSAQIIQQLTGSCGHLGTLGNGVFPDLQTALNTTSDICSNYRQIAEMQHQNCHHLVMEVSSHALVQNRTKGLHFKVGVLTNLTRDHLDYHGTFEAYADAKRQLFLETDIEFAIINGDDAFGQSLIADNHLTATKIIYTLQEDFVSQNPEHLVVKASNIEKDIAKQRFLLQSPWGKNLISLPLIGSFNLSNALAVISILSVLDFPLQLIAEKLQSIQAVPGRMEVFSGASKPVAVVDYAHTPDGLEKALSSLREHVRGRLICVFGCGGDRDKGKRPMMAKVAESLADIIIITDDNPRNESGDQIVADIVAGLETPERAIIERDRKKSIRLAFEMASPDDCILVAGKGHEDYQIIGNEKISFSDRELVDALTREAA